MQEISMTVVSSEAIGVSKVASSGQGEVAAGTDFAAILAQQQAVAVVSAGPVPGDAPASEADDRGQIVSADANTKDGNKENETGVAVIAALLATNTLIDYSRPTLADGASEDLPERELDLAVASACGPRALDTGSGPPVAGGSVAPANGGGTGSLPSVSSGGSSNTSNAPAAVEGANQDIKTFEGSLNNAVHAGALREKQLAALIEMADNPPPAATQGLKGLASPGSAGASDSGMAPAAALITAPNGTENFSTTVLVNRFAVFLNGAIKSGAISGSEMAVLAKMGSDGVNSAVPVLATNAAAAPAADTTTSLPEADKLAALVEEAVRAGVAGKDQMAAFAALGQGEASRGEQESAAASLAATAEPFAVDAGGPGGVVPLSGFSEILEAGVNSKGKAERSVASEVVETVPGADLNSKELVAVATKQAVDAAKDVGDLATVSEAKIADIAANSDGIAAPASAQPGLEQAWSRTLLNAMEAPELVTAAAAGGAGSGAVKSHAGDGVARLEGETLSVSPPAQTVLTSTSGPGAATVRSQAAPEELPTLIVRTVHLMVSEGTKTLSMRLDPPSLGELHVEVTSSADGINVRLLSPNAAARDVLQGQVEVLREALDKSGLGTAAVSILPDGAGAQMAGQSYPGTGSAAQGLSGPEKLGAIGKRTGNQAPVGLRRVSSHEGILNVFV